MIEEKGGNEHYTDDIIALKFKAIDSSLNELKIELKGKVDDKVLKEIIDRKAEEISKLQEEISKLYSSDGRHAEALSAINATLKGFENLFQSVKQDMSELSRVFTEQSQHISALTAILQERSKMLYQHEEPEAEPMPWWMKIFKENSIVTLVIAGALITLVILIIVYAPQILEIFHDAYTK